MDEAGPATQEIRWGMFAISTTIMLEILLVYIRECELLLRRTMGTRFFGIGVFGKGTGDYHRSLAQIKNKTTRKLGGSD